MGKNLLCESSREWVWFRWRRLWISVVVDYDDFVFKT